MRQPHERSRAAPAVARGEQPLERMRRADIQAPGKRSGEAGIVEQNNHERDCNKSTGETL